MAAHVGRSLVFTWGGAAVLGVQTKNITVNNEVVDITSDEDAGYRTLLSVSGERSIDIGIEGVAKDHVFLNDLLASNPTLQKVATLTWPNGAFITGTFHLAGTGQAHPYKAGTTFEGSLQSTGTWTFTPGS